MIFKPISNCIFMFSNPFYVFIDRFNHFGSIYFIDSNAFIFIKQINYLIAKKELKILKELIKVNKEKTFCLSSSFVK